MSVKAPTHLASATRRWFESVTDDYDLEQHHVRLLTLAAEAWDRGEQARKTIKAEGMTYTQCHQVNDGMMHDLLRDFLNSGEPSTF